MLRVLVTGGHGFLGQHLVKKLIGENYLVVSPSRRDYDLRRREDIQQMFKYTRPDIVIHAAAHAGGIGLNQARPADLFYDNAIMGIQMMEHAWQRGVKKYVQIGTICSYPKFTTVPFHEEDLWNGYPEETNAPYGLAKKMLLVQAQAYRQQYGFNAIYLMPVNMYGPYDHFEEDRSHVIPALIKKFVDAKERDKRAVVIWGDGTPTREFLYVEDCAEAIVRAMEIYNGAPPVNIGGGFEVSISQLVTTIANLLDFRGKIMYDHSKPNGQPRRCLDGCRAWDEFNYQPRTPLTEGLKKTIDWYLKEGR